MGWRRAFTGRTAGCSVTGRLIAAWLIIASAAIAPARAAEPGASLGRYEGHDYLLLWPPERPAGIIVFLHTAESEPLLLEASAGLLEALAASAASRNYAVLAPSAPAGGCPQGGDLACWNISDPGAEFAWIDRIIAQIEYTSDVSFAARDAVGFGHGAQLLLAGFSARELGRFSRVGLIEPEAPGAPISPGVAIGAETLIYLEADMEDEASVRRAQAVLTALDEAGYADRTCVRARVRTGTYSTASFEDFLVWFARDCRVTPQPPAPPISPTAAAGTDAPTAQSEPGEDDDPAERARPGRFSFNDPRGPRR
ncbi:MAG: hypothetical protein PVI23_01925 [Maricaulaceae bacterium]|jgi:hypothetical protein